MNFFLYNFISSDLQLPLLHSIPYASEINSTRYVPIFVLTNQNVRIGKLLFESADIPKQPAPQERNPSSTLLYLLSMDYTESWDE